MSATLDRFATVLMIVASGSVLVTTLWPIIFRHRPPRVPTSPIAYAEAFAAGRADAPVVLLEYADLECPACRDFHIRAYPEIEREYVSTGRLRFVFKNFSLPMHSNSLAAAKAAGCASSQGSFWAYHDLLFDHQDRLSVKDLETWADQIPVQQEEFHRCLKSADWPSGADSTSEALGLGLSGTPTFLVGRSNGPGSAMVKSIVVGSLLAPVRKAVEAVLAAQ